MLQKLPLRKGMKIRNNKFHLIDSILCKVIRNDFITPFR